MRPSSNSLVLHGSGTCLHEPESLEHSQEYRTNAECRYRGEDCSVQHSRLERPYSHLLRNREFGAMLEAAGWISDKWHPATIVQRRRTVETAATLSDLSRKGLPVPNKVRQSTWSLIQYAKLVAVSPSLDASKDYDDDPQWLEVLQARLKDSRQHDGYMDDTFLPVPKYNLTLTFGDGSQRAVLFGAAPGKIHACRVLMDGRERVVMSPGLPEHDRIISRCRQGDLQTVQPTSTFQYSAVGILISLITYFLYLMLW